MAEIRYLSPDHPKLNVKLAGRLREAAEKLSREIASGVCQDWSDYKYRCGKLQAIVFAINECEETERELNK